MVSLAQIILTVNLIGAVALTAISISQTFYTIKNRKKLPTLTARIFFLFLPLLGKTKAGKPWGVVYDALTKAPIDPVVVTIAVHENGVGEFKQERITDIEGRFSFLVTPGRYVITVEKTHYLFPSKIIKGETDGKYKNVYHGEVIEVENPYIINLNIPMDPEGFDWNQSIKPSVGNATILYLRENARNILLLTGFTLMVIAYFLSQNGWYLGIGSLYAFNALFWKIQKEQQLWGTVSYRITGELLPRVTVKAIRKPSNITVGTTTTDLLGRYFLLLSKGK